MEQQTKQVNYVGPFITMVFLFFIVGFLTTANTQFQGPLKETFLSEVGGLKNTFATLITFSWFLAYPLCGGVGSSWIGKHGYKGTLIRGLVVMFVGLGLFFLSSWFTVRFPEACWQVGESVIPGGFFIFLLGSFVAMSEIRIDQLMAPFFALMVVIVLIVVLLMRFSLPDVQGTKAEAGERLERSVWSFRHLALGVVAIFFYVGVEVCIGGNINLYAIEMNYASPALLATLYWGGMLIGRLVGSSLSKISPRTQLTVTTSFAAILTLLAITFDNPWLLTAVGLFHSIMWGAIFTLSVAHLGKYTSVASGVFMIGVVGGAVFPLLQGVLADVLGGWRWSWCLVIIGELFMLYYALVGSRVRECDKVA